MANSTFPHGSQWKCAGRTPVLLRATDCAALNWRNKMFPPRDSKINRRNSACPPAKSKSSAGCGSTKTVRCSLKSKSFKSAIFLAVAILGFVGNAFSCGPSFPNNLLDAGDNAVLQAPVADFQRELERMKLVTAKAHA